MSDSLILLDDYRVHKIAEVVEALYTDYIHINAIPGRLTPIAQPLDLYLTPLVKDCQRKCYDKWGLEQEMDDNGRIPYPTRALMSVG